MPVTLDEYKAMLLPEGDYSIAGDICHAYLTDKESAGWIYKVFPNAKIIMLLRNPADKAFSQYNWLVSHGYEYIENFEEALQAEHDRFSKNVWKLRELSQGYKPNYLYFRSGLYSEQISRYLKLFHRKNVLFLKFDDFVRKTNDEMNKIYIFLGVNPQTHSEYKRYNIKKRVRSVRLQYFFRSKLGKFLPTKIVNFLHYLNTIKGKSLKFSPQTRATLLLKYKEDIVKTQAMTGLDLSEWMV
jgi:hypothetical protein